MGQSMDSGFFYAYLPGAQILITIGVNDTLELIGAADVDDGDPVVAGIGQDGCGGHSITTLNQYIYHDVCPEMKKRYSVV